MTNETAFRALVSAMNELDGVDERVTIEFGGVEVSLEVVEEEYSDDSKVSKDAFLNMFVSAMNDVGLYDEPVSMSVGGRRLHYSVGDADDAVLEQETDDADDAQGVPDATDEVDGSETDDDVIDESEVEVVTEQPQSSVLPPQESTDTENDEPELNPNTKLYSVLEAVASIEKAWVVPAEVADVVDDLPSRVSATMSDLYREKGMLAREPRDADNGHNAKQYRLNKSGVAELRKHN